MAAPKGHKRYGGRKKGSQNKITLSVKESVLKAFDDLGGIASLVEWARTPVGRAEFYRIWAKLLPSEVNAKITGALSLECVEEIVDSDTTEDDQANNQTAPPAA